MSASAETIADAQNFINSVELLSNYIYDIGKLITDEKYRCMYNELAKINENGTNMIETMKDMLNELVKLRTTNIYLEEKRRSKLKTRKMRFDPNTSDEDKLRLAPDTYIMCPKCDRVMTKSYYKNSHSKTDVCRKGEIAKQSVKATGKLSSVRAQAALFLDNKLCEMLGRRKVASTYNQETHEYEDDNEEGYINTIDEDTRNMPGRYKKGSWDDSYGDYSAEEISALQRLLTTDEA